MRHLDGTYEPDRARPHRFRFVLSILGWGLLLAAEAAGAFLAAAGLVEAFARP